MKTKTARPTEAETHVKVNYSKSQIQFRSTHYYKAIPVVHLSALAMVGQSFKVSSPEAGAAR